VSPPQVGYNVVIAPQLGYQVPNTLQVGYNIVSAPQVSNIIPRNVSETATNNTPNSARIYDEKRRCWICNDEKHFASNCPNKSPSDNNIIQNKITETDMPTNRYYLITYVENLLYEWLVL